MSEDNIGHTKFRLEEARFFYRKMEVNLQNRTKFRYYLDAFLASARSVFHVFESEFHENRLVMNWYNSETEIRENLVVKFFITLRNISLKEHTPKTKTIAGVTFKPGVVLSAKHLRIIVNSLERVVDSNGKERWATPAIPPEVEERTAMRYDFVHDFKWFKEEPDVMQLCKKYLSELEKSVTEAESLVKKNEL